MLTLGLNIDHVATLREARYRGLGRGEPDLLAAALACERAGAHGITIHLREDRRHIQDRDVTFIRSGIATRLNLEMAALPEMARMAIRVQPHTVCLVPEKRQEVTTEGGLDAVGNETELCQTVRQLNNAGIDVSLFITPDPEQVAAAARIGAQLIELHTGAFAEGLRHPESGAVEIDRLARAAVQARQLGLRVNAGHGLTAQNVSSLFTVPFLEELNIGHSIVSRALFIGLELAVREMLDAMAGYPVALP